VPAAVAVAIGPSSTVSARAGSYSLRVGRGRHRVFLEGVGSSCDPVPCQRVAVREVDVFDDAVLDIETGAVTVTGFATDGGAAIADGVLAFVDVDGAASEARAVIQEGAIRVRVFVGTYDVWWAPDFCVEALPCQRGPLRRGVRLSTDGAVDVELGSVTVAFDVSINDAAFPDAADGVIAVVPDEGLDIRASDLREPRVVLPGRATVWVHTFDCTSADVPCGSVPITDVNIVDDGVLPVVLRTAVVQGRVRIDGVAPNDNVGVQFVGPSTLRVPLIDGRYQASLFAGDYNIVVDNSFGCDVRFPCASTVALTRAIASGGALDVALVSHEVVVTVNDLPEGNRGHIEAHADDVVSAALPATGPATATLRVFAGPTEFRLQTRGDENLPATSRRLSACFP
jgi:hypothetical protein